MSNTSFPLLHQPGHVFETTDSGQLWLRGNAEDGLLVQDESLAVNMILAEFSCVLPPLSADDPGCYPVFNLARGVPGDPDFWCPETSSGGVFLRVTYEPSKARFHFGMNAGTSRRDLRWVSLGPAPVEHYTRRVLRISALIAPAGLYPSVEDPFSDQEELFGELALSSPIGLAPWSETPGGSWWVTSGSANDAESFPAGYGLSDVRITLIDFSADAFDSVPYSGALDHLASARREDADPENEDFWGLDFEDDDQSMSDMLLELADDLDTLSGGASVWARRAEGLAEETRHLARRVPEGAGPKESGEVYSE